MDSAPIVLGFDEYMLPKLTELAKAAYDETEYMRAMSYSENRVQEMIAMAVFSPNRVCGFAYVDMENKGAIVGALVGSVGGVSFSDEPVASDVFSFVKKEFRDGPGPKALLAAYERWAKNRGVKHVFFSDNGSFFSGSMVEQWTDVGTRFMRSV